MTGEESEEGVKPCLLDSNLQQAQFRREAERLSDMEPQNTHHMCTHTCVCVGSRHTKMRQKKASGKCRFSQLHGYYSCSS